MKIVNLFIFFSLFFSMIVLNFNSCEIALDDNANIKSTSINGKTCPCGGKKKPRF